MIPDLPQIFIAHPEVFIQIAKAHEAQLDLPTIWSQTHPFLSADSELTRSLIQSNTSQIYYVVVIADVFLFKLKPAPDDTLVMTVIADRQDDGYAVLSAIV